MHKFAMVVALALIAVAASARAADYDEMGPHQYAPRQYHHHRHWIEHISRNHLCSAFVTGPSSNGCKGPQACEMPDCQEYFQ